MMGRGPQIHCNFERGVPGTVPMAGFMQGRVAAPAKRRKYGNIRTAILAPTEGTVHE